MLKKLELNSFQFVTTMWLLSRLFIVTIMRLASPPLPQGYNPIIRWDIFIAWDSQWYHRIVTEGYFYADNGLQHSVAFFPLFPLLVKGLMNIGFPFEIAAPLVNNLAFFGAMFLVYRWVEELYDESIAKWTIAVMAWFPFSLFGTVAYTEGLFLLLSTATLRFYHKDKYFLAAICGALTTAARPPGMVLIPTLLIVAWKEKRPLIAYIVSLLTGTGVLIYSLFCWVKFNDPLAFIHVQKAWHPEEQTFYGWGWVKLLMKATLGHTNWNYNWLNDPWYPLLFLLICFGFYWLWRSHVQLGETKTQYGICILVFLLWMRGGTPILSIAAVFGGIYLLWHLRSQLNFILVIYGFCSLGLILSSGVAMSPGRLVYGIVSVIIALGFLLARYPRVGYPTIVFFAYLLGRLAVKFSLKDWAG